MCFRSQSAKEQQQQSMGNDHLTEIHLIEIVIFQLIESFNY